MKTLSAFSLSASAACSLYPYVLKPQRSIARSPSRSTICQPGWLTDSLLPTSRRLTTKLLARCATRRFRSLASSTRRSSTSQEKSTQRINVLKMWLDYGFELGNHTFSHASLNQIELKDWEDEVVQGESVTRMLLAQRKMKLRYFRHPYLDTGRDLADAAQGGRIPDAARIPHRSDHSRRLGLDVCRTLRRREEAQ